jgi:hypothetical protein
MRTQYQAAIAGLEIATQLKTQPTDLTESKISKDISRDLCRRI